MATEAASIGATPFAGLVPWLASLWKHLKQALSNQRATQEEQQVLHLIEFATSRFGGALLRSAALDDLDDQLDELVGSPEALSWTVLLAQYAPLFQAAEPVSAEVLAEAVGQSLGAAQGRTLTREQQVLDAWLDAQRQAFASLPRDAFPDSEQLRHVSLADPEIPVELAKAMFHGLRAGLCSLAITHVMVAGDAIEPWLAKALTDRLVESVREHLRLLASIPNVSVSETIVPSADRLDLVAIEERHRRARNAALRALDRVRLASGA